MSIRALIRAPILTIIATERQRFAKGGRLRPRRPFSLSLAEAFDQLTGIGPVALQEVCKVFG